MDDSWGNIIYLIAMAIFIVFGALKKKKPSVAVHPPDEGEIQEPENIDQKSGFDSVLETLLGGEIPKPYVQPEEEILPDREESMMEEYARLEKIKEEARGETKKDSILAGLKTIYAKTEDRMEVEENELDQIDWRQAIIYREILDKKYN
ncbi:hypothetical protein [Labilibaculum sp.]|uniref:hypothetical protein n=1 Tax=Labilibaculum sp. TaxID=2060723 RepID=UPI003569D442